MSGADPFTISKRLLDAWDEIGTTELMKIAVSFQAIEDKLESYADEVTGGVITRAKTE